MTNKITDKILKYSSITLLAAVSFLPLYVANPLFFPFITGKAFVFRILVELAFALWLILLIREKGTTVAGTERSVAPRINSITIAITAFVSIIFIADLLGLNVLRSFWSNFERMEGWITLIHLWAYFIVLSSIFGTGYVSGHASSSEAHKNWHRFFNVVLIAGFITAMYGLFQFFGWADIHQGSSRVDASLGNSAYMAVYMIINAFLAGYMAFDTYIKRSKFSPPFFIYSLLAIFFSFIMFQTATRGTILGWVAAILVSLAIYAVFGKNKKGDTSKESSGAISTRSRLIASGAIVLVLIIGTLFYFNRDAQWIKNNQVLGRIATISISDTKTQARGFIWPMALKGVFETPKTAIIGVGQENFNYIFNAHYDPKMWAHEQWFDRAHSVFIDWLVAGGLIGFISYLSLYLFALIYIIKSHLHIGQKSILIGLLVGYGIHNIFVFDNQTSYIMFFTVLAFIHSFLPGKVPKFLHDTKRHVSEDYITVRDYIFVPIIVILLGTSLYFINIRPIQANTGLIAALRSCSDVKTLSTKTFEKVFDLDQTVANQETLEQLYSCSGNVLRSQLPQEKKIEFYNLTKTEIEKQASTTPNDARLYILAGNFFDSIGDWSTGTAYLEKAHKLSPTKQSIASELALNYLNIGKSTEAIEIAGKAYESDMENYKARTSYIITLIYTGEEKKAIEIFGKNPEFFEDEQVINAYVTLKQYDKAIALYKSIMLKNPNEQRNYSALASIYLMNGQKAKSIETIKIAGDKFPEIKKQADAIIKQIEEGKVGN